MARKVLIDCDPGIEDAIALCLALFDERLDVVAITAAEGKAAAEQSTRNVQAIVDTLDPPKYPRLGKALALESAPPTNTRRFQGADGMKFDIPLEQIESQDRIGQSIMPAGLEDALSIAIVFAAERFIGLSRYV